MCTPEDVANCEDSGGCVMHGSGGSCPPGLVITTDNTLICEICDQPITHQVQVVDSAGIHVFCSIPCSETWVRLRWNTICEVGFDKARKEWICHMRSGDTAILPMDLWTALVATCPYLPFRLTGRGDVIPHE